MKYWLKKNFQSTVTKFMISYSLVLLLPLFIGMIGYQTGFKIVEQDIKDINLAMINQGKDIIDHELSVLNSIVMQISSNPNVNTLAEIDGKGEARFYYDAKKSIQLLSDLTIYSTVSIVDNLYIYFKDSDYVITSDTLHKAKFYHQYILKENDSFEAWKSNLFEDIQYGKYLLYHDRVDYIQYIPFSYNANPEGAVVATIKKDKLTKFFYGLNESTDKGSFMYVEDKNGMLITSLSKDGQVPGKIDFTSVSNDEGFFKQTISNEQMIVIYTVSSVNGWKYVLVIPEEVVLHKLINFQKTIVLLFCIALVIGIVISYYMAHTNGKPINRIIQELREFGSDDGSKLMSRTFESLGGTVSTLITNNKNLVNEIKKQQPMIQAAFLQKLIKGEFANANEVEVLADSAGVDINCKQLQIVAFRIFAHNDTTNIDKDTLKELNIARIVTKDILKKYIAGKVYFYDVDHLTTVCIIEVAQLANARNNIRTILEKATVEIVKEHGIKPFFGIANEYSNVLEVWRAYEEAKLALNFVVEKNENNFEWYHNIEQKKERYYYPLDFEQRLMKYTKTGDHKNINGLLKILYIENFEKRQLEGNTIDKLYNEIISTIVKLTQPNTDPIMIEQLNCFIGNGEQSSIKMFFDCISDAYIQMSAQFNQEKTDKQLQMIQEIKQYINQVYVDPALGLSMVASQFNISEGYLSFFFKDQTGINFTDYVEQLRINTACELLIENDLTISEIGERIGYNSVQSFRRAFKRIKGVSPSEMRKK